MAQIHWASAVSADFSTAGDWVGGVAPAASDDAILDAAGTPYTVTVSSSTNVSSIQTDVDATLSIALGSFDASAGTGAGANAGTIEIGDGATLGLAGTFDNSGKILLDSIGDATNLEILSGQDLMLTGGGTIRLSANGASTIDAAAAGSTLTNVDNKITGVGQLGSSNLTIVNEAGGKLKANGALPLVIAAPTVTNSGAIKAAIDDNMILSNTTVNNGSAGVLKAKDGAQISLQTADIIGGTLITVGSGVIQTTDSGSQLDGSTFTVNNSGQIEIDDNTALTIQGAINNTGTITLAANLGDVALSLANNTTLTGGGDVTLTDSAGNAIGGSASVALNNVDNTISGAGALGGGGLVITNEAAGVIDASGAGNSLTIDTGLNAITNDGLIEATGAGGGKVKSGVVNNGTLEANGGALTLKGAVSGTGQAVIAAGMLTFSAAFNQNVSFTGASGVLVLAHSQAYTASITGFSHSGANSLDLKDIAFVSSSEATFVGATSGGTLTVTDGTRTAKISLVGDYTTSTFVASSDGSGGVIVVDPTASEPGASSSFVQAMATLAPSAPSAHGLASRGAQPNMPMLATTHLA